MTHVSEIASDVYRISTYVQAMDLQFNQFLVLDDEPLLYHTGMRSLFPDVRDAVARIMNPSKLRWIGFSHFEADECGALREWQREAPRATALCSLVGKHTSVDDVVAERPARAMAHGEALATGRHRFRFLQTPHVPHGWDASMLHEEVNGTLFCSDVLYHKGDVPPTDSADRILERFRQSMQGDYLSPWCHAYPCSEQTRAVYRALVALEPSTLAIMHGSAHSGSSHALLARYAETLEEFAGPREPPALAA